MCFNYTCLGICDFRGNANQRLTVVEDINRYFDSIEMYCIVRENVFKKLLL